ncbi:DUF4832 domain-containing protein [Actinoplanes sp. TFC3]|uniref:DUF4832 domain-containing protein n=1 Tax=Actinoplanes sp. TFC3 TaxID=1710355 RepID=UPI000829DE56|nr:DUF4832 domain-containing protein [Actinoplanes sp. TFC3]
MRLAKVIAVTATFALLLTGPAGARAATPGTVTHTYAASAATLANPGRGFFTFTETYLADDPAYTPLDAVALREARIKQARTLVYRIFYLPRYRSIDTISAADLKLIRTDFTAARTAGVKLVVRFAYAEDSDADAPAARIVRHLAQLGPILKDNADVLAAVQAGLVGRWGEWYYTQNFAHDTDWSQRATVVQALLANTAATTPVQVRTPAIKRRLANGVARVGVHNDCFLASADDFGTFQGDDRAWLAQQSSSFLVGGETCGVSEFSGWANAVEQMAAQHWTYLNPCFDLDVLNSWGSAGLSTTARKLGYRLRLVKAVLPARPGTTATATITLTNDGWAAPVQNRPVRLIVQTGAARKTVTIPTDLRTWQPGRTVTLTARFTTPAGTDSPQFFLSLPDPATRLATNPAYAVQLANTGVWDAATGWNRLS